MSLNLASLLRESARRTPTKTAIVGDAVRVPYAEIHALAQKFAGALGKLGIARGEHTAIMLPNVPQFTAAYFGAHYAASPVVPLNVLFTADELAYHLEDSDAAALVVWAGFLEHARPAFERAPRCRHLIVARAGASSVELPAGAHDFAALVAAAPPETDLPDTDPGDTAVILYTSGTTGRPKGAELSHVNLLYNAEHVARLPPPLDFRAGDSALLALPLFHSFGQTVLQNTFLLVGGTLVLMPRFEPVAAARLIHEHGVTFFAGVPTMYFGLLNHPDVTPEQLASVTKCLSGGAPMPVEVMRAFDARFGVNIIEGYGLSETSPVASLNPPDRPKKPGSIGMPLWGVEFRLLTDDGKLIDGPGGPGEICIKGHNVMKGYYKRPDATAEAIQNGWFRTGDVGIADADGYYFIVDRKKDMLIRGGFNVYPREVEEVLYAHPAVAEAAVIGVPDAEHGEEVKAFVVCRPGTTATAGEIIEHCKARLAAYKYPRSVEFLGELPKGPTGKILKRRLRASASS